MNNFLSSTEISVCKVRRAINDLRCGVGVIINRKHLVVSTETLTETHFNRLKSIFKTSGQFIQATTDVSDKIFVKIIESIPNQLANMELLYLSLPTPQRPADSNEAAAARLLKLAKLLPCFLLLEIEEIPDASAWVSLNIEDIACYNAQLHASVVRATEPVKLSLHHAEQAEFHVFRSEFEGTNHYAILVGNSTRLPPVVRLHSSCYTGDLLNSLQCDCNAQLTAAIRYMNSSPSNAGMVIYLSQDGRGIGLVNKIRTYALQARGLDTVQANQALGFEADERDFSLAASILKQFQVSSIRLLTNNANKISALEAAGIRVVEVLPLITEINQYNKTYLQTKKHKMGHKI